MKVILATNNDHKIAEFKRYFDEAGVDIGLIPIKETGFTGEIAENADSFEGNAFIKANALCGFAGMTAIADDSGLCVDALGGAPGVYSSRYAGEDGNYEKNNEKLLAELGDLPYDRRTARFISVICACRPDGRTLYVRGESEGIITFEPKGEGRFGYDPLFYYPPLGMTFAEMDGTVKNSVSHRGRAIKALLPYKDFLFGK